MRNDLRDAIRSLVKTPTLTSIVVAVLALGIGLATAVFTLFNGIVLESLPYAQADRLVFISESFPGREKSSAVVPAAASHFETWRSEARSFENMAATLWERVPLSGVGRPRSVRTVRVSASFLGTLGVVPALGRDFTPDDDRPGRDDVIIVSHALWRQLGGAPSILGQTLRLNGQPLRVIGVLPPRFRFPGTRLSDAQYAQATDVEVLRPVAFVDRPLDLQYNYGVVGRLRPGVSHEQARAELNALQASIAARINRGQRIEAVIRPLQDVVIGKAGFGLLVAVVAVAALLSIVCVNVAGLLLMRTTARRREMAVRVALGASRWSLLRRSLVEGLCLSAAGGLMGILVAAAATAFLVRALPVDLPRLGEVEINRAVLVAVTAVSLLCAIVFGMVPAWLISRLCPADALQSARGSSGGRAVEHRLRGLLVGVEVALSALLLVTAGLLVHSYLRVLSRGTGLSLRDVVWVEIDLPRASFAADKDRRRVALEAMLERIGRIPGVEAVGGISRLPMVRESWIAPVLPWETAPTADPPQANMRWISSGYFAASGTRIVAGTGLRDDVREGKPAVISQSIAQRFWPGRSPIGHRLRVEANNSLEVVGVAADVPVASIDGSSFWVVYRPQWEEPQLSMALFMRTRLAPSALAAPLRDAIWAVEPEVAVPEPRSAERLALDSIAVRRLVLALSLLFAGAALLLSCLGIYGLVSYAVARRTAEIGVRLALGARVPHVLTMVLRQGMRPVGVGMAAGLLTAAVAGRALTSVLFEVAPLDGVTFVAVAATLSAVALAACLVPGLRAAHTDPTAALRHD